jgi:mitochondrial import inner membrane translocase subunit TIM50
MASPPSFVTSLFLYEINIQHYIQITARSEPPPTYLERKRQEAQRDYQLDQANIERQKDELERLLEQDQQAMAAQVPGNLWEAMDRFAGNAPAVPATPPVSGSSGSQAPEKA